MEYVIRNDNHIHAGITRENSRAEEFIERAIELGLREIGITDHAPLPQSSLKDRIPDGKASEYCRKARELANKYSDKIEIKVGIEMDYRPWLEDEIERIISDGDFDYVIGSSHLHIKGMLDIPLSELTAQEYVDLCYENNLNAVKSGYFDVLAHVDIYRWIINTPERFKLKDKEFVLDDAVINELFSEMVKHDVALEVNTHLMGRSGDTSRIYPAFELMHIAAKYPLKYSYGSDAHSPECVGDGRAEVENTAAYAHCLDNLVHIKKKSIR